jgi:hypothetical protein
VLCCVRSFLRLYSQTLRMTVLHTNATGTAPVVIALDPVSSAVSFIPGEHRSGPSAFEWTAVLPAGGRIAIDMDFDKAFMPTDDFPPDVARGFDVPSAKVDVSAADDDVAGAEEEQWQTVWSTGLLAALPGPDLSMPFNVIAFTSTVIAFFIGSLFNMAAEAPDRILKRNAGIRSTGSTSTSSSGAAAAKVKEEKKKMEEEAKG